MVIFVMHADRVFQYVRHSDYVRKDGSQGRIAYWRSTCRLCGAAFEVSTSSNIGTIAASKAFGQVHCGLHKAPAKRKSEAQADLDRLHHHAVREAVARRLPAPGALATKP